MCCLSRRWLCGTLLGVLFLSVAFPSAARQADDVKKSNIWSVKTNAFEWLLTIPNVNFEMDLSKSYYNKMTLGLTAKYNWQTFHKITPYNTFNLLDVRPEFRYWYRTREKSRDPKGEKNGNWFNRFLMEKKNPRPWRACYVGLYADYASYSFKFSPEGIQGNGFGFGVSFGYGIPLYQYKKVAVDLELGCSLGLFVTQYDKYACNSDGGRYYSTEHKDMHLVPFPVVSELRASFAFRPVSIQHKYQLADPEKIEFQKTLEDIKNSLANINKEIFDGMHDGDELEIYAADDSSYLADFLNYLDNSIQFELDRLKDSSLPDKYIKKLESMILSSKTKILDDFKKEAAIGAKKAVSKDVPEKNVPKKKDSKTKGSKAKADETDASETNE